VSCVAEYIRSATNNPERGFFRTRPGPRPRSGGTRSDRTRARTEDDRPRKQRAAGGVEPIRAATMDDAARLAAEPLNPALLDTVRRPCDVRQGSGNPALRRQPRRLLQRVSRSRPWPRRARHRPTQRKLPPARRLRPTWAWVRSGRRHRLRRPRALKMVGPPSGHPMGQGPRERAVL
jgi:hypothetical protein